MAQQLATHKAAGLTDRAILLHNNIGKTNTLRSKERVASSGTGGEVDLAVTGTLEAA